MGIVIESPAARGKGRPRSGQPEDPSLRGGGLTAAEQILDAAARLFAENGYAATSTRAIAEAVGIRQSSLYYHFDSKDAILDALLRDTVQPSLDALERLRDAPVSATARLYALVEWDAGLLAGARHNVGALYFLPELRDARFAEFRAARRRLREEYTAVVAASGAPALSERDEAETQRLAGVVFGLVESLISARQDAAEDDAANLDRLVRTIAEASLRILGHDEAAIAVAATEAATIPAD